MTIQADAGEFITLHDEIQASTNGDPKRIPFLYRTKSDFAEKCVRISRLHAFIDLAVGDAGETVLENVDSRFTSRWRHYEEKLNPHIGAFWLRETFEKLGLINDAKGKLTRSELEDELKYEVQQEVKAMELRIEMGSFERLKTKREEIRDVVAEGEAILHRLFRSLNFDFFGCLYRQKQLKVIYVPPHISEATDGMLLTITNVLQQGHRAFILGLPLATIALCRTASEIILRDHYKIGDPGSRDLLDRFRKAAKDPTAYRKGADQELVALVAWGSAILHGRIEQLELERSVFDQSSMSRISLHWLEKLAKLVESAPKS
jgi:hypothetical protein